MKKDLNALRRMTVAWLLLAAVLLPSCSAATENGQGSADAEGTAQTESNQTETQPETVETEKEFLDNLPETYDMQGRTFNFYFSDRDNIDLGIRSITVDEDNLADLVNDAVYRRNQRLNERFNAEINIAMTAGAEVFRDDIRQVVASGLSSYDIAVGYQAFSIAAAAEGLMKNLANSQYLDFDQSYWATELIENMGYKDKLYWGTGDITLKYLGGVSVTYVNQRLKDAYLPDEDLYAVVDAGNWTIDKLRSYTEGVYLDLNANGLADINDQYGFMITHEDPIDSMVVGSGISYTVYDENGIPTVSLDQERMVSFFEKLQALLKYNEDAFDCPGDDSHTYMTTYAKGNVMFAVNKLYMTEFYFREMEDDYLVLPLPKLDETQTYYRSATHDGVSIFGIPVTAQNTEETEMLLEAMAADSKKLVTPTYIDGALKSKYSRDPETARMVDLVLSSTFSDFAMQYHRSVSYISHFYRQILDGGYDNITSQIRTNSKVWPRSVEKLVESFEENE